MTDYNRESSLPLQSAGVDAPVPQDDVATSPELSPSPTVDGAATAAAAAAAVGVDSCAWCGRGPSNGERDFDVDETWPSTADDDDDDDDDCHARRSAYDQLRFCSRSCLSRYKMDLFCRETQRYLHQLQVASLAYIYETNGSTGNDVCLHRTSDDRLTSRI